MPTVWEGLPVCDWCHCPMYVGPSFPFCCDDCKALAAEDDARREEMSGRDMDALVQREVAP